MTVERFVIADLPVESISDGHRRTAIRADHSLVVLNWLQPGYRSAGATHAFDQLSFVLEGAMTYSVGDEEFVQEPGSAIRLPAGVRHAARPTGDDVVFALDVFAPPLPDAAHLAAHQPSSGTEVGTATHGDYPPLGTEVERFVIADLPMQTVRDQFWRTGVRGDHSLVTLNWARPGYKSVGQHHHPYDQLSFVFAGAIRFFVGDDEYIQETGTAIRFPSDIAHGAEPVGDEVVFNLDVFAPPRTDYAHLVEHQMAGVGGESG
jgi:quercetin dioxygenase-like cupin family protein